MDQHQCTRHGNTCQLNRGSGLRSLSQRFKIGARDRVRQHLIGPDYQYSGDRDEWVKAVHDALYCSKICAYAQGFQLMRAAETEYKWKLDFASIASIWRGGCIIRARFLQKITAAYARDPQLVNLLLDPYFKDQVQRNQTRWRSVVALAAQAGIAAPAFMSALAYYDGYRSAQLRGKPLAGPTGLFRRPHLRTYRSTARRIVPPRLVQTGPSSDNNCRLRLAILRMLSRRDTARVELF